MDIKCAAGATGIVIGGLCVLAILGVAFSWAADHYPTVTGLLMIIWILVVVGAMWHLLYMDCVENKVTSDGD